MRPRRYAAPVLEWQHPVLHLGQWPRREAVEAVLPVVAHRAQLRLAQHLEVLGHGRLADTEGRDDVRDAGALLPRGGTIEQEPEDVAPGGVRDHTEDVRHVLRLAVRCLQYHERGPQEECHR